MLKTFSIVDIKCKNFSYEILFFSFFLLFTYYLAICVITNFVYQKNDIYVKLKVFSYKLI